MHKIHFRLGLRPAPGGAYDVRSPRTPSRMVRKLHLSPRFLPLDAFGVPISRHTERGVIGPRDNVFPGPAVALDGPDGMREGKPGNAESGPDNAGLENERPGQ